MNSALKVLAAIGIVCVSLACLAFVWEAYQRHRYRELARAECEMNLAFDGILYAEPANQNAIWVALQYCLAKTQLNFSAPPRP